MSLGFLILGAVLVIVVLIDALWTTLWVDGGGGPVSARVTTGIWRGALALVGRKHHKSLSLFGPLALFTTVIMWVVLLWAGWTFLFAGGEESLIRASDKTPADWTGRIYFVAYSMFTMGNGDYTPNGGVWQIVTSLTTATGMMLVTLSVTYLLSVVSAVVQKRAFASQVTGLGKTAEDFVRSGWNGQDFHALDLPLNGMAAQLATLSQQYEAYPILQYYHGAKVSKSPIIALAVLDEALTLLRFGVPEQARPNPAILRSARSTVQSFLETMPTSFIHAAPEPPPPPVLDALRKSGIPTVSDDEFQSALVDLRERRKRLLGLMRNDGWNWTER